MKLTVHIFGALAIWLLTLLMQPLKSRLEIGADEGFELIKAFQYAGPQEWTQNLWNDQPALYSRLLASVFRWAGSSAFMARLMSVLFSAVLVLCLILLLPRSATLLSRLVLIGAFAASPYAIELSCSAMLEVPAFALAVAAIAILPGWVGRPLSPQAAFRLLLAAGVMGLAVAIKFTAVLMMPWAVLRVAMCGRNADGLGAMDTDPNGGRSGSQEDEVAASPPSYCNCTMACLWTLLTAFLAFAALTVSEGGWNFQRLVGSHLLSSSLLHRSNPGAYRFPEHEILGQFWLLPLLIGLVPGWRSQAVRRAAWPALATLVSSYLVHSFHRPWWYYYHLHFALTLPFLGALGFHGLQQAFMSPTHGWKWPDRLRQAVPVAVFVLFCLPVWTPLRKEWLNVWSRPSVEDDALSATLRRLAPPGAWCFTRLRIHAFHARIPILPEVAILPYKRFWSGAINDQQILEIVRRAAPQLLLLTRTGELSQSGWMEWVASDYSLMYDDGEAVIYLHRAISTPEQPVVITSWRQRLGLEESSAAPPSGAMHQP